MGSSGVGGGGSAEGGGGRGDLSVEARCGWYGVRELAGRGDDASISSTRGSGLRSVREFTPSTNLHSDTKKNLTDTVGG